MSSLVFCSASVAGWEGRTGSHYASQAGLKLKISLPPDHGDYRLCHHARQDLYS